MRRRRAGTRTRGFTLIELIVVITIIGILSTVVVINLTTTAANARRVRANSDVRRIHEAACMFQTQLGRWPQSIDELKNARDPVTGAEITSLRDVPADPWGYAYMYEVWEDGPVVISYGRDGAPGGEGEDADSVYPLSSEDR